MTRFDFATKGAAALAVVFALGVSAAHAGTTPDGLSFNVKVTSAGHAPFTDCFTFNSDGRLVVSGIRRYGALAYVDNAYGTDVTWLSVTPPAFVARYGAGLMFAGQVTGGNLAATGMVTPDFKYSITGTPTTSCTTGASARSDHWMQRR
jgi:hypothetical protein